MVGAGTGKEDAVMMTDFYDSPCSQCEKCYTIIEDNWPVPECREGAPEDVFLSEWGCYHYKPTKEFRTKGDIDWVKED